MMDPSYNYEIDNHTWEKPVTIKIEDCDINGEELRDSYDLESVESIIDFHILNETAAKADKVLIHNDLTSLEDHRHHDFSEDSAVCEDSSVKGVDSAAGIKVFNDNEEAVPITNPPSPT